MARRLCPPGRGLAGGLELRSGLHCPPPRRLLSERSETSMMGQACVGLFLVSRWYQSDVEAPKVPALTARHQQLTFLEPFNCSRGGSGPKTQHQPQGQGSPG